MNNLKNFAGDQKGNAYKVRACKIGAYKILPQDRLVVKKISITKNVSIYIREIEKMP